MKGMKKERVELVRCFCLVVIFFFRIWMYVWGVYLFIVYKVGKEGSCSCICDLLWMNECCWIVIFGWMIMNKIYLFFYKVIDNEWLFFFLFLVRSFDYLFI